METNDRRNRPRKAGFIIFALLFILARTAMGFGLNVSPLPTDTSIDPAALLTEALGGVIGGVLVGLLPILSAIVARSLPPVSRAGVFILEKTTHVIGTLLKSLAACRRGAFAATSNM
jgi:hypothetical protein